MPNWAAPPSGKYSPLVRDPCHDRCHHRYRSWYQQRCNHQSTYLPGEPTAGSPYLGGEDHRCRDRCHHRCLHRCFQLKTDPGEDQAGPPSPDYSCHATSRERGPAQCRQDPCQNWAAPPSGKYSPLPCIRCHDRCLHRGLWCRRWYQQRYCHWSTFSLESLQQALHTLGFRTLNPQ